MKTPAPLTAEQTHRQAATLARPVSQRFGDPLAAFDNGRPEALAQLRLQEAAGKSAQTAQLKRMQAKMYDSSRVAQMMAMAGCMDKDARQAAQRQAEEEEEPLQARQDGALQLKEGAPEKPNNTGLPNQLKTGIESLSGMSMDHVQVHYNSSQPAQLNALAYAQGSDIHVAPGQEQHLPHEAWHVVQQAQGRVQPTTQMKTGVPVNDDVGLETEADVMGARAAAHVGDSAAPLR
ncbi:eCIS core domain-containing protein [Janthinobacterium fluminis]|uniref:DUF4157 domain-containing protein n=1 Tax=Janthinobacterium fluminis TaxID=2987524 RepID=A0ABT5JW37_9BURK|nr:DUF4157 domain-containing protein [Janthinobacterium fluminis]MDC8756947.1 DUF4157 domain-containing protein [Janthinobacterium fluminis]